jgi:glycosyltransferase involved in cell wall biosynthesis
MKKEYANRYPFIENKSFVIYNGVDEDEFKGERELVDQKKLTIFYAGSFYSGIRSPFPLLKTLDLLSNDNKIDLNRIEIKIAGNLDDAILTEIKTFSSGKTVNYLGRIKRSEVLTNLKKAHLLWLIIGEEKAHYTGFPVKGFEYIGARRPIMVFTPKNSEPERIINELSCGSRFSNDDKNIEHNANIFMNFYNKYLDNSLNNPLELNGTALKKYTRKFQAKQLKDLIDKL